MLAIPCSAEASSCDGSWPLWQSFVKSYVLPSGRVVDLSEQAISTSEGQSYAMFSALVANDRVQFDHLLNWTINNLAQGDLKRHLPSWRWGRTNEGGWKVLDINSASDADIWIAYSLFHAAKKWGSNYYKELATAMLRNIAKREVVDLPGVGSMLLPAPYGFSLTSDTWRLNPSYLPVQLLRYFALVDKEGPWNEMAQNTLLMIAATSRKGLVPDWVLYSVNKGFYLDAERGGYTGYDAIRVYMWWTMLSKRDPLYNAIRPYLVEAAQYVQDETHLPERISLLNGIQEGWASSGIEAAWAPFRSVVFGQKHKIPTSFEVGDKYYDAVLGLLVYGWLEQRYQFEFNGGLLIGSKVCLN
jgi:endoglucanase